MTIELDEETQRRLEAEVQSGRYASVSEVIREAIRLLEQREETFAMRRESIRQQIEEGWDSARRGEFVDGDKLFEQIEAELGSLEPPQPK